MCDNSLGCDAVVSACERASVRLEGDEHGRDLGPCQKCCGMHPKKLVAITGTFREKTQGRERVFMFTRCTTNCNTSRLHMGGRVVLVVTVRGPRGALAEAVSAPLSLVSRSTYVHKPHRPLAAPHITWVDYAEEEEVSCASSVDVVQERLGDVVCREVGAVHEAEASRPDACDDQSASPGQSTEEIRLMLLLLLQLQGEQLVRVALVCDALWMRAHSLDSGAIASACEHASVRLEGDEHGTEAVSAPLSLVSRSTYVHRPRLPLATPRITWVDCVEDSCGPSTAVAAQERPASAVGSAESSGEEEEAVGCAASPSQDNEDLRVTLLLLLQLQAEQLERVHQLERLVHWDLQY
eukprot:m51a1_g1016 hypothetical protein (352) ;mRNA; f:622959-627518